SRYARPSERHSPFRAPSPGRSENHQLLGLEHTRVVNGCYGRMAEVEQRDVVILGSGPAGLTAALYAGRANLKPLVLKGVDAGGQLMLTTEVENYPGFPDAVLGPELMEKMEKQAARFDAELLHQEATRVDLSARPFSVWSGDEQWRARTLIIATGAKAKMLG